MRVVGTFLIVIASLIGGLALLSTPAGAQVPAFVVTTPVNGATFNRPQLMPFSGSGLPGATARVCTPDAFGGTSVVEATIDASGSFSGSILIQVAGTSDVTFEEIHTPGGFCRANAVVLARVVRSVTLALPPFGVASPTDNATLSNRTVGFSGSGVPGFTVLVCAPALGGFRQAASVAIDANGNFAGSIGPVPFGTSVLTFQEFQAAPPPGVDCVPGPIAQLARTVTIVAQPFIVTAPVNNALLNSRTVAFTGSGVPGFSVLVCGRLGEGPFTQVVGVTIDANGNFSGVIDRLPFGASVITFQEFNVPQVIGSDCLPGFFAQLARTVTIVPPPFVVTNPADASTLNSQTVAFSGSGVPGFTLLVCEPLGITFRQAVTVSIDASGNFAGSIRLPLGTAVLTFQEIVFSNVTASDCLPGPFDQLSRTVTVVPPPFVVSTPANNATLSSLQVAFSGSALPGGTIRVCSPDTVVEVAVDAAGSFGGTIALTALGTTELTFDELQAPVGGFCRPNSVQLARILRTVTIADPTFTPTPTSTPTPTVTATPSPTGSVTPTSTPTVIGAGGGGGGGGGGGPNPGATPELDSLILFGSGLAGLAGLARLRIGAARRRTRDKGAH